MIGRYPRVFFALLLVHPHSTNQLLLSKDMVIIKKLLLEEKQGIVKKNFHKAVNLATGTTADILCDKLYPYEREELCDDAMKNLIIKTHGGGSFESFIETEPEPDPPRSIMSDPYTCKEIPVEQYGMKKRMYWCPHRRYTKMTSDVIRLQEGFFIMGSRKLFDRAFMFSASPTDSTKVIPLAKLEWVNLLYAGSRRCFLDRSPSGGPSSSSPSTSTNSSPVRFNN